MSTEHHDIDPADEPDVTAPAETPEVEARVVDGEAGADAPADPVAAERDEYLDALRRMKAEFDNYRKRAERDRQSAGVAGAREVVRGLLPVLDNLERAIVALGDQGEAIVAGIDMVRAQLAGVLAGHGVAEIPAAVESVFDPNLHEAIAQIPVPGRAGGTIVEVVEKGYTHADLVLRPSRVVVAADGAE